MSTPLIDEALRRASHALAELTAGKGKAVWDSLGRITDSIESLARAVDRLAGALEGSTLEGGGEGESNGGLDGN